MSTSRPRGPRVVVTSKSCPRFSRAISAALLSSQYSSRWTRDSRLAVPRQTAPVRWGAELGQPLHPRGGQFTQAAQLGGLGLGFKDGEVLDQRFFDQVIARQRGARAAQVTGRALLGGAPVQAFVGNQPGGRGGDLAGEQRGFGHRDQWLRAVGRRSCGP
jgi:hypothetical protein